MFSVPAGGNPWVDLFKGLSVFLEETVCGSAYKPMSIHSISFQFTCALNVKLVSLDTGNVDCKGYSSGLTNKG